MGATIKSSKGAGPAETASPIINQARRFLTRSDIAFVFHLFTFILYLRVWMWHTTPAALVLPGASGFGWFFRYLTFYSFTLQLFQFSLCILAHLAKNPKRKLTLHRAADRLSCATFGLANTVTAMFFAVENTTHGLVEGGQLERPWWLGLTVHVLNSAVAWIDLVIVEERNFCGRSRHLALTLALTYSAWLLLVRENYGKFPYPVLNKLPMPWGFLGFFGAGIAIIIGVFELGKFTKHTLLKSAKQQT